jgi:hypothetical protein
LNVAKTIKIIQKIKSWYRKKLKKINASRKTNTKQKYKQASKRDLQTTRKTRREQDYTKRFYH